VCSTAADELDGLSDGELLEHVKDLVAEQNRLAARLTGAVRAAENRQSAEHPDGTEPDPERRDLRRRGEVVAVEAVEAVEAVLPILTGSPHTQ
jgi:hypothetical protein